MNRFPLILADEDIGKLIGFVVIAVIWGIGALASMISKASKAINKPTAFRPAPAAPPPIPKVQPMQRRVAAPQRKAVPVRQMTPIARANVQQRAPALPQMPARPAAAPVARRQPVPAQAPSPNIVPVVVRPIVGTEKSASISRWLRPESIRKQFILTELLQPPVVMRPPRES